MLKALQLLLITLGLDFTQARSYGVSNVACQNMTPNHGGTEAQISIAKVQILPHLFNVSRGKQVKISLQSISSNSSFRGFMIQARGERNNEVLGIFLSTSEAKVMVCGNSYSTASHSNPLSKSLVELLWKAPTNFRGAVRFQ